MLPLISFYQLLQSINYRSINHQLLLYKKVGSGLLSCDTCHFQDYVTCHLSNSLCPTKIILFIELFLQFFLKKTHMCMGWVHRLVYQKKQVNTVFIG